VCIAVRDIYGNKVQSIVDGNMAEGAHSITFDTSQLNPGTYFCHVYSATISKTIKLVKTE
jgi:hypothetical protein